jgi:hypothetical protein
MKIDISLSLDPRILIVLLLTLAANADDPVMILAANGVIELESNDAWLPDLILRKSLSE